MKLTRFEELECWQQARELTKMVYKATTNSSFKNALRLPGQIQSVASSAMANIAEGFIRRSDREFIQFFVYCYGVMCRGTESSVYGLGPGLY